LARVLKALGCPAGPQFFEIPVSRMSYEEEDACMPYEEEDTYI
jgi:hypothetical protein